MSVPEIVLQEPEAAGGICEEGEGAGGSGCGENGGGEAFGRGKPLRPSGLETTKLLTLVVCGGGGGSGGSSTVVDGGGSEGSVVVGMVPGVVGAEGGGEGITVVPARKSPVTVQEWVDSLPHSGATTPVPHEASHSAALLCRSEEEEGEERTGLAGEWAAAVPSDMVEDGLGLGAEAGHLYTGCVPDETMCPLQPTSGPSPPAPSSQTSRRERSGGGSSLATAKRREAFAGRRDAEGVTEGSACGGSFQSDSHSPASHSSIDSLLESRRPDPEEMLFGLGFGGSPSGVPHASQASGGGPGSVSGSHRGAPSPFPYGNVTSDGGSDDEVSRIPRRFLQPSKVKGVAINDFFKYQQDLIETFESGFCGYRGLTGPSHTVPSVIVAKIMEKLREHERENSSRGSVASFGTGPMCHSPTPPPTPPFSPTSIMVGSPLTDDRLSFLQNQPNPNAPIVSPVESQPTTNKFSKVARNVMHRTSILTRMSSCGGDSVASGDDAPGIACSPTSRASLSVLTPDNRKFLDSQGSKSPEMRRKRMIIGQRSFTFDHDGDLIEDLAPPETPTSPTMPTKPPLMHKDSIVSSVASLTSCDSDSDTDSAPNFRRSNSTRSTSGRPVLKARTSGNGSSDSAPPTGPWPLGKRMSSTSLSSWEEMGETGSGPASTSHFAPLGQRPRFLSIDEGDDENMEGQEEGVNERWVLGDGDVDNDDKWNGDGKRRVSECESPVMETGLSEHGSNSSTHEKMEGSIPVRENSMNEGLWELELDKVEVVESKTDIVCVPKDVPCSLSPLVDRSTVNKPEGDIEPSEACSGETSKSNDMDLLEPIESVVAVESETVVVNMQNGILGENVKCVKEDETVLESSRTQDVLMPSVSSLSNFSSCSSAQDSCASSLSIRRGSLKRQTKIDIEDEPVIVEMVGTDKKVDTPPCETPRAASPSSQSEGISTTEPSQQVSEVSSVVAEPVVMSQSSSAAHVEKVVDVARKDGDFQDCKEEERPKRTLSPHGRSSSAHSDSSGFLEWEPPAAKVPAMPLSPPLPHTPPKSVGGVGKGREWIVPEGSNQQPSADCKTTIGSSGYYGDEGLSSEMTGQQLLADTVEMAVSAFKSSTEENVASPGVDAVGKEVAIGGHNWQGGELAKIGESHSEGSAEETLQLAHQELCFVREMRCCVSEGMERVMQFLGTRGKRRHRPCHHPSVGDADGDSTKVSSIMSQMTFLLKEQSKLCYEMEQLSMQRLLDGQILGASNRQQLPDLKVNTQLLGIRDGEKDGTMMVHGKDGMNGSQQCPPSPTQFSMDSGANSREEFLEGLVEQNARELAELKSLLKAILTPSNKNDVH